MVGVSAKKLLQKISYCLIVASVVFAAGPLNFSTVYAGQAQDRTLQLSDDTPAAHNVIYHTAFRIFTAGTVGSVEVRFCSNSSLVNDPCVAPWGFDALHVTVSNRQGISDWGVSSNSSVNDVILTRPASAVGAIPISFDLGNIINPTDAGSYFARVYTYPTTDGSGPATDSGGLAFSINDSFLVSAEVPPYLIFCTGVSISGLDCSGAVGDQINLGELSPAVTSSAQSQMLVATNAGSGYNITASGNTFTSGNNVIPGIAFMGFSLPGKSQFGINLRKNTKPAVGEDPQGGSTGGPNAGYNTVDHFKYVNGDAIASNNDVQDYKKYTVSYIVNVSKDQAPGVYSTTLTYICVANF